MNCKECGADFTPTGHCQKFCSVSCRKVSARNRQQAQRATAECEECNASFQLYHSGHRFCSAPCREKERAKLRGIISRVKYRAGRDDVPFNLTTDDITIPEHCPVLGLLLVINQGRRGYHPDSISLDRIVPTLGYTRGNVRIISARANLLKSDATVAELEAVLADLKEVTRACV